MYVYKYIHVYFICILCMNVYMHFKFICVYIIVYTYSIHVCIFEYENTCILACSCSWANNPI